MKDVPSHALIDALQKELSQVNTTPREVVLTSGHLVGEFAGYYYYRFEVPEGFRIRRSEFVRCTLGSEDSLEFDAQVISIPNQYITIAFQIDLGPVLPQIKCSWSFESTINPIIAKLSQDQGLPPLSEVLMNPASAGNALSEGRYPFTPPDAYPELLPHLKTIFKNRVSFVWGPVQTGKTELIALTILALLRDGKRVLYLSERNEKVDEGLVRAIEMGKKYSIDLQRVSCRVGLPTPMFAERVQSVSLEHAVFAEREFRKKSEPEEILLMEKYLSFRITQLLNWEHFQKVKELREIDATRQQQVDALTGEVAALKEQIEKSSGTVKSIFRKGLGKEDPVVLQKKMNEKLNQLKVAREELTAVTASIMKLEAASPIDTSSWKEYQLTIQRINELGGVDELRKSVEGLLDVDEESLLASKALVATSIAQIFIDPRMRALSFDTVIVDDVEGVSLPYLVSLSSVATEQMILVGDPFQVGPTTYSNAPIVRQWLQRDIFSFAAGVEELSPLLDWAEAHRDFVIFLNVQYRRPAKLAEFVSSALYDNKVSQHQNGSTAGGIFVMNTASLQGASAQYIGREKILPFNKAQTEKVVELVKHLLVVGNVVASDIGILLPMAISTIHTKQQLRLHGITNVEVGTPATFRHRRKRVIIFDTLMAGVDYTLRHLDDRKSGESEIIRLFNTVASCVIEDLYIVADLGHFRSFYRDRLFVKFLILLKALADTEPATAAAARRFDALDWDRRRPLFKLEAGLRLVRTGNGESKRDEVEEDPEFVLRMKMMEKKRDTLTVSEVVSDEHHVYVAVLRVLGLLRDVNLLSQYRNGTLLFSNCLSSEAAKTALPLDLCQNEREFGAIMERWNLLIYEKSGGSSTRHEFFSRNTPASQVRWDVKNLKAFFASDVEAVIAEGKQRIATTVSRMFQESISRSQPAAPQEWMKGYLYFLGKLEWYLDWMLEQLRK